MYAYIQGRLTIKEPTHVIIEAHGIGYEIRISLNTYSALTDQEQCKLLTYLNIKEDAHHLYGFLEYEEKKLFMELIGISGVGPGTALSMLSSMSVKQLTDAIAYGEVQTIQKIKGIGAKTAQRLILELQDKIKKTQKSVAGENEKLPGHAHASYNTLRDEALSALIVLGINKAAAEKSIEKVLSAAQRQGEETTLSLEELIKRALKTT